MPDLNIVLDEDGQETFTLFGQTWRLCEELDEFALLEFSELVDDELVDQNVLAAMAAMFRLLRVAVHEQDWASFRRACRKNKAKIDDLLPIIRTLFVRETGRPTSRPIDSFDGPLATEDRSTGGSSLRAIARLEEEGRPDLALFVVQAERDRRSA